MRREAWDRAYVTLNRRKEQGLTSEEERLFKLLSPLNTDEYIDNFIEDNPDASILIRSLAD